jgi:acetyl esterase/lipase
MCSSRSTIDSHQSIPSQPGLDDCLAATAWVDEHIHDYGGVGGQLSVAGDSSGGNLAAVVARRFRDQGRHLNAQFLLHPVIDSDYPSRHENGRGYLLTLDDIVKSARNYLGNRPELLRTTRFSPRRPHPRHRPQRTRPRRHRRSAPRPTPRRGAGLRRQARRRGRRRIRQGLPRNDPHLRLSLRNLHRCEPGAARTGRRVQPSSAHPSHDA